MKTGTNLCGNVYSAWKLHGDIQVHAGNDAYIVVILGFLLQRTNLII